MPALCRAVSDLLRRWWGTGDLRFPGRSRNARWAPGFIGEFYPVGHNLDFDLTILCRYGLTVSSKLFDTLLASALLSLGRERASQQYEDYDDLDIVFAGIVDPGDDPGDNELDAVVCRYLGIKLDKTLAKVGNIDWGIDETPVQRQYRLWDVEHLFRLQQVLTEKLSQEKLWSCFLERSEFAPHLHWIKMLGNPIDVALCKLDFEEALKAKESVREEVRVMFQDCPQEVPKSRRKKLKVRKSAAGSLLLSAPEIPFEDFSPNNPAQVVAALATHGIVVEDARKATLRAIDSPETKLLLHYAEAKSRATTINGILKSIFSDNRVRVAGWNQLAARTGRIHSKQPNLQNIDKAWRKAFRAPPGYVWMKCDLSQIEVYIAAIITGDETLIGYLKEGKDVYVMVAAQLFGKAPIRGIESNQVNDELRKVAKILVLGIIYCLTPFGFVHQIKEDLGIEFEQDEAERFFEVFFTMFPRIREYHESAELEAANAECVYTITGQRRFLPPLKDDTNSFGYSRSLQFRKRVLANTPIQGSAANLQIRSVNYLIPLLPPKVEVVNLVHDEIDLLVPTGMEKEVTDLVGSAFDRAFKELFGDRLKVAFETAIGPSWGELKKMP